MAEIWQFTPQQIDRMAVERAEDSLLAAVAPEIPPGVPTASPRGIAP
jgi:hypothetical protein